MRLGSWLLLLAACQEASVESNYAGLRLSVVHGRALGLTAVRVEASGGDDASLQPATFRLADDTTADPLVHRVPLFFPESFAVATVIVAVTALAGDREVATATIPQKLLLGRFETATVSFGLTDRCGDGRIDSGETCDDGNAVSADGCDNCRVDVGWQCLFSPSRCARSESSARVDASAACPGNGTAATPFCSLQRALDAPWPATVFVASGTYSEAATVGRSVAIWAEPGAVIQSASAPALSLAGDQVQVDGLAVRGEAGLGGGVEVTAGRLVRLSRLHLGPGTAPGLVLAADASLVMDASVIDGHAGGGLHLDSGMPFRITNLVIRRSGDPLHDTPALAVRQAPLGARLSHLTMFENRSSEEAFQCATGTRVHGSIAWQSGTITSSVVAACGFVWSDLGPLAPNLTLQDNNFSTDPMLLPDGHLSPVSPCRDRGKPGSVQSDEAPATDFDGEVRPLGPNLDVGADEVG